MAKPPPELIAQLVSQLEPIIGLVNDSVAVRKTVDHLTAKYGADAVRQAVASITTSRNLNNRS